MRRSSKEPNAKGVEQPSRMAAEGSQEEDSAKDQRSHQNQNPNQLPKNNNPFQSSQNSSNPQQELTERAGVVSSSHGNPSADGHDPSGQQKSPQEPAAYPRDPSQQRGDNKKPLPSEPKPGSPIITDPPMKETVDKGSTKRPGQQISKKSEPFHEDKKTHPPIALIPRPDPEPKQPPRRRNCCSIL